MTKFYFYANAQSHRLFDRKKSAETWLRSRSKSKSMEKTSMIWPSPDTLAAVSILIKRNTQEQREQEFREFGAQANNVFAMVRCSLLRICHYFDWIGFFNSVWLGFLSKYTHLVWTWCSTKYGIIIEVEKVNKFCVGPNGCELNAMFDELSIFDMHDFVRCW